MLANTLNTRRSSLSHLVDCLISVGERQKQMQHGHGHVESVVEVLVVVVLYDKTSPPQSHLGRVRRYPHVGECTLPLRVLAVAYAMRNEALLERYGTLWKRCAS